MGMTFEKVNWRDQRANGEGAAGRIGLSELRGVAPDLDGIASVRCVLTQCEETDLLENKDFIDVLVELAKRTHRLSEIRALGCGFGP